jgi:N-acetylmuramoyl-L-alanine amidase
VVGHQTWSALVEAGFRLGDRFLYLRRPMLRGDDVADLQRRLSALGFDSGRVDGIFGGLTSRALGEFQRNTGLSVDAILGASTLRELRRVTHRHGEAELVSSVRARDRLRRAPRTLLGRRVAIGEEGGLDALVAAVRRRLVATGAQVVPLVHPDGSARAAAANAADADVYLGLRLNVDHAQCTTAYYSGFQFESAGGRRLAELVETLASAALGVPGAGTKGMTLAVLRETRMPAVVCEMGPPPVVVRHAGSLAEALVQALVVWAATPFD